MIHKLHRLSSIKHTVICVDLKLPTTNSIFSSNYLQIILNLRWVSYWVLFHSHILDLYDNVRSQQYTFFIYTRTLLKSVLGNKKKKIVHARSNSCDNPLENHK